MEHDVSDWDAISTQFSKMFQPLGEVTVTKEHLSYSSIKPHVATGIMLTKEGMLIASMPLHNIDSCFERVIFDECLESIRLVGPMFDYTYTIPSEILQLRGDI
tara:strand:+ start:391 stop:699 length:309 start_codon:yes stop_codon:yes gene_type:complete